LNASIGKTKLVLSSCFMAIRSNYADREWECHKMLEIFLPIAPTAPNDKYLLVNEGVVDLIVFVNKCKADTCQFLLAITSLLGLLFISCIPQLHLHPIDIQVSFSRA
jgi:hypothetical protein